MSVEVRPVRDHELPAVAELVARAYVVDGLITPDHEYVEELRAAADRAARATVLVALDPDGTVAGTVTLAVPPSPYAEIATDGEAEIRMLAVDPGARGRGLGEVLMRAAIDEARDTGARTLVLTTIDTMRSAHRLYERLGLVRAPERDWGDDPDYELWVYVAPLRSELEVP
ncbi:GNAT family N-acetyltransferase [Actinotalea ferrariae]|uniref:GNAT family N-acetyltransferase n=1 Tax=Actinotalea ferrariae TaxID=1386098 RepID=UPI001C8C43E1|nr:GNAT family N-acetyltransferase [Actinotalea ferrariae]MBX9245549.1 GNAT family N-acetyltransferase [Actinotalea ferrariae]